MVCLEAGSKGFIGRRVQRAPEGSEKWQSPGAGAGGGPGGGRMDTRIVVAGGWPSKLGSPAAHGAASAPGPRAADSPAWEGTPGLGRNPTLARPRNHKSAAPLPLKLPGKPLWERPDGAWQREMEAGGRRGRCGGVARRAQVEELAGYESWAPAAPHHRAPTSSAGESLKDPFHR